MTVWLSNHDTLSSLTALSSVYLYLFCPCPSVSTHPVRTPPIYILLPPLCLICSSLSYLYPLYLLSLSLSVVSSFYCMFVCCTTAVALSLLQFCMSTTCCIFLVPKSMKVSPVPRLYIIHDCCDLSVASTHSPTHPPMTDCFDLGCSFPPLRLACGQQHYF